MTRRTSQPIDRHLGAVVRAHRKARGMSQVDLAQHLGLTFQQIQKYERGINRISASALYEIASALDVPVSALFDGLPENRAHDGHKKDCAILIALFPGIDETDCPALACLIRRLVAVRRRKRLLN